MKKAIIAVLVFAAAAGFAFFQASPPASGALAGYCPAGPLLYLEAKDFARLVRDWNTSAEKRLWLQSANYEVFSRSRLFGKLADAQNEFAAAAGISPDMPLVESIAGGNSALALYDIGKLEFLYITRLPSARAIESALWKTKAKFEPRNAAGRDYYVRSGAANRTAAFAVIDDLLLLATREDLVSGALSLMAGQASASVKSEGWFDEAIRAAGASGELRLALNMQPLMQSPHFRSYWIQRNVSELRQYRSGVIDMHRSAAEYREERILLRVRASEAPAPDETPVARILRLVPDDAGFYRAWASPERAMVAALIEQKILNPARGGAVSSRYAPRVAAGAAIAGTESDLETRIDEPPLLMPRFTAESLRRFLETVSIEAALQLQSSRVLPDGVFVDNDPVIVLQAASDWDINAARAAMAASNEGGWGTEPALSAQGRLLFIGKSDRSLQPVLARVSRAAGSQGASYAAGYRHSREFANYTRMMRLMDFPSTGQPAEDENAPPREPQFFSENVASIGTALARVRSASIAVHERGPALVQTVTYRLQ
jgi:hypothetical protein